MYLPNISEFRLFLEHIPVAVAMFDRNMRYIATSPKWFTDYGLKQQSLIGCCHYEMFPNPDKWKAIYQRCLTGVESCEAVSFIGVDGSVEWYKWECHPWYDRNCEIGGVIFFSEVITKQKQIEEALRQSETHLSKLIFQFLLQKDGVSLPDVSPGCEKLIELEPTLRQCQEDLETTIESRTAELQKTNVQLQAEIIERQQVEEALRQSEARFHKLVANIPGMIYQYVRSANGTNYFSYVSPACSQLYELEPKDIQQDITLITNLIHQEDRPGFNLSMLVSAQTLQAWKHEFRIITPNGRFKWVQTQARPEKQASGDIVWNGVMMDITERKQTEEALRQSESKFRILFEKSADGILLYDGEVFFDCNQAAVEMMGCSSKEQLLSLSPSDISPEFQPDGLSSFHKARELTNIAYTTGSTRFEWTHRRLNGEDFLVEVLLTAIPVNGKKVFYTVWRDITARKQAEEERQKFVSLVENSSDFIGIATLDSQSWYLNEAGLKLVGLESFEQFQQTHVSDYHTPEDWEYFQRVIAPAVMEKGSWQGEFRFRHFQTGELVPIDYYVFVIQDQKSGQPIALANVTRDITERKQAEAALRQSTSRYRELALREQLLNRLASQIRESLDLDTVLEKAIQEIRDLLNIDRCSFSWFKSDTNPPTWETLKEAKNPALPSLVGCHSIDKVGPCTGLFLKQEILQIDDVTKFAEPLHRQFLESLGIKSEIVLPIKTFAGQIGVIVCNHSAETRPWTDGEVELLEAVVDQLAIAINQAELYTQTQQAALTAQKQAQQLQQTLEKLQKTQTQLVQSEKMSSLGQLVAGVAHEINNPVNFIYGNLEHANIYTQDILGLIKLYQQTYPQPTPKIEEEINAIDLDFLVSDLPKLMNSMKVGSERIREIVQSLRTFSRLDEAEMKKVDIHQGIESTLMILQHRLKPKQNYPGIEVIKNYANLPKVVCYPGQLNQVFMNLLANAIDALEEGISKGKISTPTIRIATKILDNDCIAIHIADNGSGMTPEVQRRLFDPFFTTKPVGVGTGLGLSISYQIVVDKHRGQLHCKSHLGQGTEFVIEIPVSQPENT